MTAQLILSYHRSSIQQTASILTPHYVIFSILLLIFGAESFDFQFSSQKYENQDTQTVILPVVLNGCEASSPALVGGRG